MGKEKVSQSKQERADGVSISKKESPHHEQQSIFGSQLLAQEGQELSTGKSGTYSTTSLQQEFTQVPASSSNSFFVQPKLIVGLPNDRYEKEAEQVASLVVDSLSHTDSSSKIQEQSTLPTQIHPLASEVVDDSQPDVVDGSQELEKEDIERDGNESLIQTKFLAPGTPSENPSNPRTSLNIDFRGGQPLNSATRNFFEPWFGRDFSRVRVHTNTDQTNALNALAFTAGQNIVFRSGQYSPDTLEGKKLLAHELTHVVQQTGYRHPHPRIQRAISSPGGARISSPDLDVDPTPPQVEAPRLILEDTAADLDSSQMTKSNFLRELRSTVCSTAEEMLAGTGRSTEGCPYLDYWFEYYDNQDSRHIERAVHRYAPETLRATSVSDYIDLINVRARRGIEVWIRTGEITEIPEGVSVDTLGIPSESTSEESTLENDVQFKTRNNSSPSDDVDPQYIHQQLGSSKPLEGGVKARMESAFGTSFSGVEIHADSQSESLANQHHARAFTVGEHVAFAPGEYKPGTLIGDALIAHELAHTIQQRDATSGAASNQKSNKASNSLEAEADRSAIGAILSSVGGASRALSRVTPNIIPTLKSGLALQRCPLGEYDWDSAARGIFEELSKDDYEDINRQRIFRLLENLDDFGIEQLKASYERSYSPRREGRTLTEDLRHVLLSQSGFLHVEGTEDLYRAYKALGTNIVRQDRPTSSAANHIEVDPPNAEVLPGSPVTYRMVVDPAGPDVSKYSWIVENDPTSEGPRYFNGPDSRVWENAEWSFPGRHKIICMVEYRSGTLFFPTYNAYFYEYVQVVRDLRELAREEFGEEIERQTADVRREHRAIENLANQIRKSAVDSGLPETLFTAWARANAAIVLIEAELRDASTSSISSSLASDARSKLRRFYELFRQEVESLDQRRTHRRRGVEYTTTRNPYFHSTSYSITLSILDNPDVGWSRKLSNFYSIARSFDEYIRSILETAGESETAGRLEYAGALTGRISRLLNDHPDSIGIRAVFYPENQPLENEGTDENPQYDLQEVPLNWYAYREDDEWHLADLTNPQEAPRVNAELGGTTTEPPLDLFEELNDARRFPKGVLFWEMPSGQRYSLRITHPITWSAFLTWLGIGLAVLAIGAATLGAGTAATALIIGSGVVGAAAAAADIAERSDIGALTTQSVVVNVLSIITSLGSAGTAGLGRLVVSGAMRTGRFAQLAVLADRAYIPVAAITLGTDVLSLVVFADTIVTQYNQISSNTSLSDSERENALMRLVQLGILTGGISILGIRGGIGDIRRGRQLALVPRATGEPTAIPTWSRTEFLDYATDRGLNSDVIRLLADATDDEVSRVISFIGRDIDEFNDIFRTRSFADLDQLHYLLDHTDNVGQLKHFLDQIQDTTQLQRLLDVSPRQAQSLIDQVGRDTLRVVLGVADANPVRGSHLNTLVESLGVDAAVGVIERKARNPARPDLIVQLRDMGENLQAATVAELRSPTVLGARSVIADSNVLAGIKQLLTGTPWSALPPRFQAAVNRVRVAAGFAEIPDTATPTLSTLDDIVGDADLRAPNIVIAETRHTLPPALRARISGLPLSTVRSSPEYRGVVSALEDANVGAGNPADISAVADAIFSQTSTGIIPHFVTIDRRVFARLAENFTVVDPPIPYAIQPGMSHLQSMHHLYPNGQFTIEIPANGRNYQLVVHFGP